MFSSEQSAFFYVVGALLALLCFGFIFVSTSFTKKGAALLRQITFNSMIYICKLSVTNTYREGKKCLSVLTFFPLSSAAIMCLPSSHKMAYHRIFYVLSHSNGIYLLFLVWFCLCLCALFRSFVYNSCANFPSVPNIQLIHSKSCLLYSSCWLSFFFSPSVRGMFDVPRFS